MMRRQRGGRSLRRLQATFFAGGLVAAGAGLHTVFTGARSIAGQDVADASVESELRFYAVFYVAFGLSLLHVAPRVGDETVAVRALAGALFMAGLARAGGWHAVGRPHRFQQALAAIELAGPPLVIVWQKHVANPR